MVPQSYILYCREIYKISGKIIKFNTEAMKNWKVELKSGGKL